MQCYCANIHSPRAAYSQHLTFSLANMSQHSDPTSGSHSTPPDSCRGIRRPLADDPPSVATRLCVGGVALPICRISGDVEK